VTPIERLGLVAIRGAEEVGALTLQSWQVTRRLPRVAPVIGRPQRRRATVQQMLAIGADALPMAAVMSFDPRPLGKLRRAAGAAGRRPRDVSR
jgi:hypothetical protein